MSRLFGRRPAPPPTRGDALTVRDRRRGALDLGADEIVVLLGASGHGKTAWVRSLLGLGDPFDTALAFGEPLSRATVAKVVSWVPEGDGVFLSESVWANLTSPAHGLGDIDHGRAADALDLVGLGDRLAAPVSTLGAGGRRRVALARAVARRRPVLVVDGALDATLWPLFGAITDLLPWLRAVLVATSRIDDLARRADTVALIGDGVVVGQAPLGMLEHSRDAQVRSVLAWVSP